MSEADREGRRIATSGAESGATPGGGAVPTGTSTPGAGGYPPGSLGDACHPLFPNRPIKEIVERSSQGRDDGVYGIGGSYGFGDNAQSGIRVPTAPTIATPGLTRQQNRYLMRLCGIAVPAYHVCRVYTIRQALTIGVTGTTRQTISGQQHAAIVNYPTEILQTSPFWHFSDANTSWHLRMVTPNRQLPRFSPTFPTAKTYSSFLDGVSPAVLFTPPTAEPYTAPSRGKAPGLGLAGLSSLSTFRDIRFPWGQNASKDSFEVDVAGPCWVNFYASLMQSDPETRPKIPAFSPLPDFSVLPALATFLPPEEIFLLAFPAAIYHRIAGAIVADVFPQGRPDEVLWRYR